MNKAYPFLIIMAAMALLALALFPDVQGQGHTVQVRLSLSSTSNKVYVPGVGEVPAGGLGPATYTDPDHCYLASYSGGYLAGLVAAEGNSISVSSAPSYHTLELDQDAGGEVMVVFSSGDWDNIEKEILLVESGKFLTYPSPSFGSGLGDYYPVTVLLRYTGIDIVGSLDQSKGNIGLYIENTGASGGRPVILVGKS